MTRPTEHGRGEASHPIAGDPASFPSDAELARTLIAAHFQAALSTLTEQGWPYGSSVSYAVNWRGCSNPADLGHGRAHGERLHDPRASMLFVATTPEGADPLSSARLTLVGVLERLEEPGAERSAYLDAHPHAAYYADFTDFGFWRLEVERCRYVGGFGHMSWVDAAQFAAAAPDPIVDVAAGVIEHMNDDHPDANLTFAQVLAGLDTATGATMVGVDRYGVTLQVTTPNAPRLARVPFDEPLSRPDQARGAVVGMLDRARAK